MQMNMNMGPRGTWLLATLSMLGLCAWQGPRNQVKRSFRSLRGSGASEPVSLGPSENPEVGVAGCEVLASCPWGSPFVLNFPGSENVDGGKEGWEGVLGLGVGGPCSHGSPCVHLLPAIQGGQWGRG